MAVDLVNVNGGFRTIGEDDLGGYIAISDIRAGYVQIIIRGGVGPLDGHHAAVGIQIDGHVVASLRVGSVVVLQVVQAAQNPVLAGVGVVIVVGGAADLQVVVALDGADGTGHLLRQSHRLDLAIGDGQDDHVVLGKFGLGVELAIQSDALGAGLVVDRDGVVVVVLNNLVYISHIGVDKSDHDLFRVGVHKALSQNTVAGGQNPVVAAAGQIVGIEVDGLAVYVHGPGILVHGGRASGGVEIALRDLGGPGALRLFGVGADLVVLVRPNGGGTAKIVGAAVLFGQIAIVQLLAQLHNGTAGLGCVVVGVQLVVDGLGIGAAAGDVVVLYTAGKGDVADREAAVGLGLDGAGLQGVQHKLSQIVPGHGLTHAGVHILEQVDLVALSHGGQLPVAAEVAAVLEVAQSLHQHQGRLSGGHTLAAAVGGGAGAGGDAVGPAGGHIGLSPGRHVGEGRGVGVSGHIVSHQVGHDNGHLITGDILIGVEVAGLVAHHDANRLEHFNGFHIVGVGHIRVAAARGAGAHHHQAGNHGRGETQAESTLQVSHWNSSF